MTTQIQHVTHYRFTVDDYHAMADAGILKENARVELVQGEIVEMAPMGDRHVSCVFRLTHKLATALDQRAIVSVQCSLRIDEYSEPEPDAMLLQWRDDYYASSRRAPADVLLIIELSDTTLLYDRNVKLPLYANAGIPEVWIVDLQSGQLEVFTEPSSEGYASSRTLGSGDSVSPSAFGDISLSVNEIIP
jgi:Uma2 family endonuclease